MTHVIDALGRIKEYWGEVALADLADYSRGYLIRGGATDWEAYDAKTDGAALVGDGTDIISTLTPTWKGPHTFDAGLAISAGQGIAMADETSWFGVGVALERIVFNAAGYVSVMGANFSIGTPTPGAAFHLSGQNFLHEHEGNYAVFEQIVYRNSIFGPNFFSTFSRGTKAIPLIVQNNDRVLNMEGRGYDTADLKSIVARIAMQVDGVPGANDMPGRITLETTADGAAAPTERLRIACDGLFTVSNSPGMVVPDGWMVGIGAALERIEFYTAGHVSIMGANLGVGTIPDTRFDIGAGAMEFEEMAAPAAGAADTGRLYCKDNGAGKTQLIVKFSDNAEHILATMA